jgi:hypothetical protein
LLSMTTPLNPSLSGLADALLMLRPECLDQAQRGDRRDVGDDDAQGRPQLFLNFG